ncbi:MAG: glycosyltransferase family 4 protein [Chloroflexi bacterium]|nr:glycosyltransferase family 4 protein [Chloroflexota bacterium]
MVNKFLYRFGGTERYLFDQCKFLERRGHEVIPFAMAHPRNWESQYSKYFVSNVEYDKALASANPLAKFRIALRLLYSLEAKAKISALIERTCPDVAHIHNIYHQISPSILPVLHRKGIPVVQTVHDFKLVCPGYSFFAQSKVCEICKSGNFLRAIQKKCVKNSRAATALAVFETYFHRWLRIYDRNIQLFITPSAFSRNKLIEYGVEVNRVVHIPPPVDLAEYAPRLVAGDYALYFGRLVRFKGLMTLLKAMKGLRGLSLVIAGEGEMKDEIERTIAHDGLDNVRLVGYVGGDGLKETIQRAKFVVVPSECYENAPFAIFESFALGKAVVGSRIGGIPELIDEGTDGLLFTPGDVDDLHGRLAYLLDHPKACASMGRNGRNKLQMRFSLEKHYDRLENIYSNLRVVAEGRKQILCSHSEG